MCTIYYKPAASINNVSDTPDKGLSLALCMPSPKLLEDQGGETFDYKIPPPHADK
jgi:hypothetical protein